MVYGTGQLTLILDKGHFSETSSGSGELANGSFTLEGDKITFSEEETSPKAKSMCGSKVTYSYQWKFDAKKGELYFTRVKDDCENRAFVNTSGKDFHPWRLKTQGGG